MGKAINTGIMSYGMSGQLFHSPFVDTHEGFEFKGVVERSQKRAHQKYPNIKSYDSVEDMLADGQIELVIVNTPNNTHFELARKVLQSGKNVLVEKPFTVTVEQAEELFALAKKNGCHVLPYQNRRFDSDYLAVKKIIESGELGRLVEVHFRFDRYKIDIGPKAGKETPVQGSGLLFDLGPHLLDQVISLFGIPLSWTKTLGHFRPNTQVDDFANLHLIYPQELQVFVTTSLLVADIQPAFVLHGTKGSFVKYRADVQEEQLMDNMKPNDPRFGIEQTDSPGTLTTIGPDGSKSIEDIESEPSNYLHMFDAVYGTIRNGDPYPITEDHIKAQLSMLN
ncbi:Gfo/Idh/MocA family oxidoreductase [Flagellimonas sp.]|uniref:Gfo/Idh/MocA family oxidoreductase n=1 Tax=Flagellimonas sp. TaxID=2058762 RepID=UPI003BA8F562